MDVMNINIDSPLSKQQSGEYQPADGYHQPKRDMSIST